MHHHLVKECFAVFNVKITMTMRAFIYQDMIVSIISSELLNFLHPNLVWWHIILSWSVL